MAASFWWAILIGLMIVSAGLMIKLRLVGSLISLVLLYVYLQASSHFFWVPWYKGGGNGVGLADWFVWLMWAFVMTGLASVPLLVARLTRKPR